MRTRWMGWTLRASSLGEALRSSMEWTAGGKGPYVPKAPAWLAVWGQAAAACSARLYSVLFMRGTSVHMQGSCACQRAWTAWHQLASLAQPCHQPAIHLPPAPALPNPQHPGPRGSGRCGKRGAGRDQRGTGRPRHSLLPGASLHCWAVAQAGSAACVQAGAAPCSCCHNMAARACAFPNLVRRLPLTPLCFPACVYVLRPTAATACSASTPRATCAPRVRPEAATATLLQRAFTCLHARIAQSPRWPIASSLTASYFELHADEQLWHVCPPYFQCARSRARACRC